MWRVGGGADRSKTEARKEVKEKEPPFFSWGPFSFPVSPAAFLKETIFSPLYRKLSVSTRGLLAHRPVVQMESSALSEPAVMRCTGWCLSGGQGAAQWVIVLVAGAVQPPASDRKILSPGLKCWYGKRAHRLQVRELHKAGRSLFSGK